MPILIAALFILTSTIAQKALAGEDDLKRLHKCHALFLKERIPPTHSLWLAVSQGTKSGTDACMEIFDKGLLGSNNELSKNSNGNHHPEGIKVLNTFLKFQKSQFQVPDYGINVVDGSFRWTRDVIDNNEAAYHFLYTLFKSNQKYSDLVTRDFSLRASRLSQKSSRTKSVLGHTLPSKMVQIVPEGTADFFPTFAETGLLIGIHPDNVDNSLPLHNRSGFTNNNVNQHFGAGPIGTQAYIMANNGNDEKTDGAARVYRRWGKHVMEDLLCRNFPALRSTDVVGEVNVNSQIAFRQGISCMGCHASMDSLAGVIRNIHAEYINEDGSEDLARMKFWGARASSASPIQPTFPILQKDSEFWKRPPLGRLNYRSYDGKLVRQEMEGLHELGHVLKETNDLYVCAAKTYYYFLTGISVSLADSGDVNTKIFTPGEKKNRERVIQLGLDLKGHQSGRTLIKKIIETPAFISPDKGL